MNTTQLEMPNDPYLNLYDIVNDSNQCDFEAGVAVLTLYCNGTIRECNQAAAALLDCLPSKLIWQHVSTIMPELARASLMQGERVDPNIRYLSHIGYGFEVIGFSGVHFACALFFNEVENFGRHCLRLIMRPMLPQ
jgi:hypothetical protein